MTVLVPALNTPPEVNVKSVELPVEVFRVRTGAVPVIVRLPLAPTVSVPDVNEFVSATVSSLPVAVVPSIVVRPVVVMLPAIFTVNVFAVFVGWIVNVVAAIAPVPKV